MQITQNTDRRLVIEHRPWLLGGAVWLTGLTTLYFGLAGGGSEGPVARSVAVAVGGAMVFAAWYWFAFLRITFDRARGEVEHVSRRPFGTRAKYLQLARVRGACIEANWDSEGVRLTRLALDTEDGRAQLEYGYSGGDRRALEQAVNEWLTRPI